MHCFILLPIWKIILIQRQFLFFILLLCRKSWWYRTRIIAIYIWFDWTVLFKLSLLLLFLVFSFNRLNFYKVIEFILINVLLNFPVCHVLSFSFSDFLIEWLTMLFLHLLDVDLSLFIQISRVICIIFSVLSIVSISMRSLNFFLLGIWLFFI